MSQMELQKLISLTFDENPEVRKRAAKKLAELNDPGALFALVELTYDKDASVKETVKRILEKRKPSAEDLVPFSDLFSFKMDGSENKETNDLNLDKQKRILHPIEALFEKRLGKEKAEIVKRKMMPSLERVYLKATSKGNMEETFEKDRRNAVQEFLTTYIDAISDMPGNGKENERMEAPHSIDSLENLDMVSASNSLEEPDVKMILKEVEDSFGLEDNSDERHEKFLKGAEDSLFRKAYEIMMYSQGDSAIMKKEMKRMMKNAQRDIKLAFHLAREKFRENKITKLTEIKEKMRNITTDDLMVKSIEKIEFKKPRSSVMAYRVIVADPQENEGVIYLFDGKAELLQAGIKIKLLKAYSKVINGETSLTIGSAGNIYVVI
ncbi:MAG: HEAT repeat domain-containing protein [Candidatus Micrarchaeia archaeon]